MSNHLEMAMIHSILTLHTQGWSAQRVIPGRSPAPFSPFRRLGGLDKSAFGFREDQDAELLDVVEFVGAERGVFELAAEVGVPAPFPRQVATARGETLMAAGASAEA